MAKEKVVVVNLEGRMVEVAGAVELRSIVLKELASQQEAVKTDAINSRSALSAICSLFRDRMIVADPVGTSTKVVKEPEPEAPEEEEEAEVEEVEEAEEDEEPEAPAKRKPGRPKGAVKKAIKRR